MKWKCWTISKGGELRWLGGRAMASDWRSQSFHKLSEVPFLRTLSLDILPVDHGYMFRYGSLCLRPLDNGRSLWSHGWTTGEANIWWKKWTFFRAGVSREHRVESPIYVLFNPWLPEDPTHMPRFSIVKIFTANCFQWKREGWVPGGGGGKDLRRDSFETSRQVFFKYGLNVVFIKLQLCRPWVYGQFSPTVLPAVCHLLHTSPYLRPAERANPVKVCSTFPTNWKHKSWFWKTKINLNFD